MRERARLALIMGVMIAATGCGGAMPGVARDGRPEGPVVDLVATTSGAGGLLVLERDALWITRDAGVSWVSVPVPETAARAGFSGVTTPVGHPDEIFLAGEFGVVRSADAGRTWRQTGEGLPGPVAVIAAHADSARVLFAYVDGNGVFRTNDGGGSWSRMDAGPGSEVRGMVHSNLPGSMNTGWLYAATDGGVARTMDCFCGWRPSGDFGGDGLPVAAVAVDPRRPEHVYAAREDGVFQSSDGGASWRPRGRPGIPIHRLVIGDDPGTMFGATSDGRIMVSRDGGQTWAHVNGG